MSGGKSDKKKNTGVCDQITGNLLFFQHHVCTWITVKREIPVSIRIGVNKCQCGMYFFIGYKIISINANFFHGLAKLVTKHIFSYFSNEGCFLAKAFQHGKYITGSTTRVGFQKRIPLGADAVFCEIDQQLS